MKKKLTNNLGLKLAAVVLAVIIWLVIHSIADPVITKEFTAPVEIRNEDVLQQENEDYTYSIVSGEPHVLPSAERLRWSSISQHRILTFMPT